jgi:rRNA maturation protein Nop10
MKLIYSVSVIMEEKCRFCGGKHPPPPESFDVEERSFLRLWIKKHFKVDVSII